MVYQLVFADSRPPRNVLCFGQTQPSLLPPPVLRLGRAILAIRARRAEPSSVSGPRPGGWGLSPLVSPPTVSCPGFTRGGEVLPGIQVDNCLITQVTSGAGTAVQRDAACHPEHDAPFAQLFIHSHVADT